VRYPADDLLGIIALESVRHQAIVVGEDLGTVPKEVPRALERWGMLSSKVLYFERDKRGAFKPAARYPKLALATANTHDMPTIAGFWDGKDIDVRAEVGLLPRSDVANAREERGKDCAALLERLAREKILPKPMAPASGPELRAAVHGFLCRTPSQLVGLSLDDLAGETVPVNVPGVGPDKYPSWTRKMRLPLETIMVRDDVETALRCDGRRGTKL
jgi:4-alpha-glucanotransferase